MRVNKAFTLLELMIVVLVVGILATYGIASFAKRIEHDKLSRAVENVKMIYNMQKRYQLENEQYFSGRDAATVTATYIGDCSGDDVLLPEINAGLGLFLKDGDFSYVLSATCTGLLTTEYSVTATRLTGKCVDGTVTLGNAGGDPLAEPAAGCGMWD